MPGPSQVGGVNLLGVLYIVIVLVVLFFPLLLVGRRPPDGGPPDSGAGPGKGPPRPPGAPPDAPPGGVPLREAEPARVRLRGHERLASNAPAPRRPAREPERTPVRR